MSKKSRENAVITRLLADIDRLNAMLSDSFQWHLLGVLQRMEERAEKAEARVAAQRWIPVGEMLPESGRYLVFVDRIAPEALGGNGKVLRIKMFMNGEWAYGTNSPAWRSGELRDTVTHWMPLPEPPKGETE